MTSPSQTPDTMPTQRSVTSDKDTMATIHKGQRTCFDGTNSLQLLLTLLMRENSQIGNVKVITELMRQICYIIYTFLV